ncbi:hypothetical protein ACFQ1S_04625 [Kibdelosporangium lantanae]|uniref:Uncharacterized protein n=1 Tax=Kibdelosporangium lantanae TaxID=1497396 RepID=A0ABW3M5Q0_9PSEU
MNGTIVAAMIGLVGTVTAAVIAVLFAHPSPSLSPTPTESGTSANARSTKPDGTRSSLASPVFWNGSITITADGVDFDTNPPSAAQGKGVHFRRPQQPIGDFGPFVEGSDGTLFALKSGYQEPTKESCLEDIRGNGRPYVDGSYRGLQLRFCLLTAGGRVGVIQFPMNYGSPNPPNASVVIWN